MNKVKFIDVIIPLRSVSTNVSNCIVLNFMYTKFQVSSSIKWQSYWYSNMVHLLLITLYFNWFSLDFMVWLTYLLKMTFQAFSFFLKTWICPLESWHDVACLVDSWGLCDPLLPSLEHQKICLRYNQGYEQGKELCFRSCDFFLKSCIMSSYFQSTI